MLATVGGRAGARPVLDGQAPGPPRRTRLAQQPRAVLDAHRHGREAAASPAERGCAAPGRNASRRVSSTLTPSLALLATPEI